MNIRALAASAIEPLLKGKGSLNSSLSAALQHCDSKDQALLKQICFGTSRHFPQLDAIAKQLIQRPLKAEHYDIYALLLIGLYQLLEMRIPDHAAISETVDAAHQFDKSNFAGLLNGALRRFCREKDQIIAECQKLDSYKYNHPDWFIQKLKHNWPENWEHILEENNNQAPLTLRINTSHVSRETYLEQLSKSGINGRLTAYSQCGITLENAVDVSELPGFFEGQASVQDEAAQLSGLLLKPLQGERVLDACAAPGGKLCHLLELAPEAQIEAIEIDAKRAVRIEENLQRLKLNAKITVADASTSSWWNGELFDKILVDAPCSATGVIRRNPDIKMLRKGEDIHALANIQAAILENLWPMLKSGGTLVYATCSIFPQENEKQVARFLKENNDAQHLKIDADWGVERSFGRQLFPQRNGHDGFYYAVLQKA